jgi:hypothetical protein
MTQNVRISTDSDIITQQQVKNPFFDEFVISYHPGSHNQLILIQRVMHYLENIKRLHNYQSY